MSEAFSRRRWLQYAGLGFGSAVLATQLGISPATPRRPNILIVIADDWSWPHAGIAGDPVVQTPAFDRVAREGVLFTNAFCASPSCTASRGVILTGQAAHRLGPGANLCSVLPAHLPVYPDLLEAQGYAVGHAGKGWSPGNELAGGRTRNPAGPAFPHFSTFLDRLGDSRPFCFWSGPIDPHRPFDPGAGRAIGLDPRRVNLPPHLPDLPEIREDLLDYYAEVQRFDGHLARLLALLERRRLLDDTLVVVTSDNGMAFPRAKATLYDTGTRVPLAVRFPRALPAGRRVDAFVSSADIAPTLLDLAGSAPVPEMTGRSLCPLVHGADQPGRDRVFLERERHGPCREGFKGYPARAIRTADFLYVRNLRPDRWPAGDPVRSPFTEPYADIDSSPTKYLMMDRRDDPAVRPHFEKAFGMRPHEELYDLARDPAQLDNVANRPEYASQKDRLRAELERWRADTRDPRAIADTDWLDTVPYYNGPGQKPLECAPTRGTG